MTNCPHWKNRLSTRIRPSKLLPLAWNKHVPLQRCRLQRNSPRFPLRPAHSASAFRGIAPPAATSLRLVQFLKQTLPFRSSLAMRSTCLAGAAAASKRRKLPIRLPLRILKTSAWSLPRKLLAITSLSASSIPNSVFWTARLKTFKRVCNWWIAVTPVVWLRGWTWPRRKRC